MTFPDIVLSVGNTIHKMFNNYIISLKHGIVCVLGCLLVSPLPWKPKGNLKYLKWHQQMEAIKGTLMHTLDDIIIDYYWKKPTLRSHCNTIIKSGFLYAM
jgi:hypothetical protein